MDWERGTSMRREAYKEVDVEEPLPDLAPFAVTSDETWRHLQRRRNLIRMVKAVASLARDESYPLSASILDATAERLQEVLFLGSHVNDKAICSEHPKEKNSKQRTSLKKKLIPRSA